MKSVALLLVWLFGIAPSLASQTQDTERVSLRVISVETSGDVIIDRGERDHVQVGDRVILRPRSGGAVRGKVSEVAERSARVQVLNSLTKPALGTRGEVMIPRVRLEAKSQKPQKKAPAKAPEHPPWENKDDDYSKDKPLLAQVGSVKPSERLSVLRGRVYEYSHQTWTTIDDRGDYFHRLGTDLEYSNPWGHGGSLNFDGELNLRHADIPDKQDENEVDVRLDRLSYRWGGHRFERDFIEGGRFLQSGMPEFGVLDGVEWIRSTENHDRYGASMGFLPELNTDYATLEDFQFASFYEWVVDAEERLRATAGVQKSFHHGDADRDLLIGKIQYDPAEGWSIYGSAWVDYYTAGDLKGPGFELTQGILSTRRTWKSGAGLDLSFERLRFADIDRFEFVQPSDPADLINDRYDRIGIEGWQDFGDEVRLSCDLGLWDDEDEQGFDGELAVSLEDFLFDEAYTDVALFGTMGEFTDTKGLRLSLGKTTQRGRWSLTYEAFDNHLQGFDFDDIIQHRIRIARDHYFQSGWSLSAYAQGHVFDEEGAWTVGIALEKGF